MRDVAVIAYAQTPSVRTERVRNEVEMLMPIIDEVDLHTVEAELYEIVASRVGRQMLGPALAGPFQRGDGKGAAEILGQLQPGDAQIGGDDLVGADVG